MMKVIMCAYVALVVIGAMFGIYLGAVAWIQL